MKSEYILDTYKRRYGCWCTKAVVYVQVRIFSIPAVQSPQWYAWGPPNMQCRLCASCWIYWKKYGGLKTPTQLEGAARANTVWLSLQPKTCLSTISLYLNVHCF